jgi:hypothetical protein
MPRCLFHHRLILVLFIPALISATDYFPLTVGSRWHYSFVQPNAPTTYHTYKIVSDTIIGQRHYFARQWLSSDTAGEWLYVSGNDIYSVDDLAKPDSAVKIAQKTYTTGDSWMDGSGLLGKVQLAVSYKGRDSVPSGAYDSTWSAGWADADTIAGGLILIRTSINHVYADEVGEIRETAIILGTTVNLLLDSFYIAPGAEIRNEPRPRVWAESHQAQRLPIIAPKNYIGHEVDRLYSLNGRLLRITNINQKLHQRRLPSGILIAIPKEYNRWDEQ